MKTLTPKEAAMLVLEGNKVQATLFDERCDQYHYYVIRCTEDCIFEWDKFEDRLLESGYHFDFVDEYEYTLYEEPKQEEPKQEEKKYRWLFKDLDGNIIITKGYKTNAEVFGNDTGEHIIARLDCLDDLKNEPYYTEEF